jgi:hypothetical protein
MKVLFIILFFFNTNISANEIKSLPGIKTPKFIKFTGTKKTPQKDELQEQPEPQDIETKTQIQPQTLVSDKCSPKIQEYKSLLTNRKQNNLKNNVFKEINDLKSQLQPFSPTFNCDKKTLEKLEALYQEINYEDLGFGFTTGNNNNNNNNDNNKFCNVYTSNITTNYKTQIQKMSSSLTGNLAPQAYLCRGFSNVMLINENTGISDATYIANAKSDIKLAISKNKTAVGEFKIDTIDDDMLTAIFSKYGEIATKGMDAEQRQLIADSIKEPQLLALQKQINENYSFVDEQAGTVGELKDKETVNLDLSSYVDGYQLSKNPLPLLNSIKNPNGDIKTETQTLRNFRVSEEEMNKSEAQLDDVLNVISQFNSGN